MAYDGETWNSGNGGHEHSAAHVSILSENNECLGCVRIAMPILVVAVVVHQVREGRGVKVAVRCRCGFAEFMDLSPDVSEIGTTVVVDFT